MPRPSAPPWPCLASDTHDASACAHRIAGFQSSWWWPGSDAATAGSQAVDRETFFQPFPQTIRGGALFLLQPVRQLSQPSRAFFRLQFVGGAHRGFHLLLLLLGQSLDHVANLVITATLDRMLRAKDFADGCPQGFRAVDHEQPFRFGV